jgi:hypothetical protein
VGHLCSGQRHPLCYVLAPLGLRKLGPVQVLSDLDLNLRVCKVSFSAFALSMCQPGGLIGASQLAGRPGIG